MIRWTYIERHGGLVHTIPQSSSRCKELRTAAAGSCVLALLHGRPSTFPSWATRRTAEQEVRSTARVEPLHGRVVVAAPVVERRCVRDRILHPVGLALPAERVRPEPAVCRRVVGDRIRPVRRADQAQASQPQWEALSTPPTDLTLRGDSGPVMGEDGRRWRTGSP